MIDTLLLPFAFPFMQEAFLISALVAIPMGLLSPYLVLKGWSLMGDAISHAVLPGVVLAYVAGLPLGVGAFAAGMLCAVGTGWLRQNSRIKEDTVMGVVFSGMFGLGLVLFSMVETELHLDHILFGNMLGVSWSDIAETAVIAAIVTAGIVLRGRDLMLMVFDEQHGRAIGIGVKLLHYGLLVLLSLTIVGALKAVGIILAIALLIAPGAIAFLLVGHFGTMLLLSVAISVFACFMGVYLSFFIDSAPAPTIVLLMSAMFILAFIRARIIISRAERSRIGREAGVQ